MQIQRSVIIDAPADAVWEVLGGRYDRVDEWASSVERSSARGGAPSVPGAPMAGRTCETELGPFTEAIVEFDARRHILAYTANGEKMPFFVQEMRNRWSLTAEASGRTRVDMVLTASLAFPFNLFMAPLMKLQMGKLLTFAVEELQYFVENGTPHPRKLEADHALRAA